MDELARKPVHILVDLFEEVARIRGTMRAELVEKDFWVCWTLKRVFALQRPPAGLVFKGGTSLSKVYAAIHRFSEDVDLSFDRDALGFGGENDPARAPSGKKTRKRLEDLAATCKDMIQSRFLPQLEEAFRKSMGGTGPGQIGE